MRPMGPGPGGGAVDPAPAGEVPPPPDRGQDLDGRRWSADIKVALISAAATVLAALIAGVLAVNTGTVELNAPESGANRDDLRATITSLEQEIDDLRSVNEELRSPDDAGDRADDGSTAGGTPPVTSSEPSGQSGEIVRQAVDVLLAAGHELDLDTDAPDWAVVAESEATGHTDIGLDSQPALYAGNGAELAVMTAVPTFNDCRQIVEGLGVGGLTATRTSSGTHLCVRTGEGTHAYVEIVEVGENENTASVTLTIRVWAS